MCRVIALVVLVLLSTSSSLAYFYVVVGVQRLGPALRASRVVYGKIDHVFKPIQAFLPAMDDGPGPEITATFHVEKVLMDRRQLNRNYSSKHFIASEPREEKITYHPQLEDWPNDLVPVCEGQHCILVCGPAGEVRTAIPASSGLVAETGGDVTKTRRILAAEISTQLSAQKESNKQCKLIAQFSEIAEPQEAIKTLNPVLQSRDAWSRRTALAGLAYATGETNYVNLAAEDVRSWLRMNNGFNGPDGYKFLQCYFYLTPDYYEEESLKLTRLLPIYRMVVDSNGDLDHGLNQLASFGTQDDLQRLFRFHDQKETRKRQCVIRGISRILDLGLPNYTEPDFLAHEPEFQRWVKQAVNPGKLPFLPPKDPRLNRFEDCYFSYNDYCYCEGPNMGQNPSDVVARLMAGVKPSDIAIKYKYPGQHMNQHYCLAQVELNKGLLCENAAINVRLLARDEPRYQFLHKEAMLSARTALDEVQKFMKENHSDKPDPNLAKCYALLGNDNAAVQASADNPYVLGVIDLLFIEGVFTAAKTLILESDKTLSEDDWGRSVRAKHLIMLDHIANSQNNESQNKSRKAEIAQLLRKIDAGKLKTIRTELLRLNIDAGEYYKAGT